MSQTFAALVTELDARGFTPLGATRQGLLINRAYQRLCALYRWPFLEDSAQGVAPLSIPTLGQVEAVSNEDQEYPLEEIGYVDLVSWGLDLSEVGTPVYWYRSMPAGDPVVNTWPTSTATIGVQFWSFPADMTGVDVPVLPARYHLLIVDQAQVIAERERGNHGVADGLQADVDRQVAQMGDDLLAQQSPRRTQITFASEDG